MQNYLTPLGKLGQTFAIHAQIGLITSGKKIT